VLTLTELIAIKESIAECRPHVEDFSWGPTLSFAEKRRAHAIKLINKEIRNIRKIECSEQTK
jgi:hypothetical protein